MRSARAVRFYTTLGASHRFGRFGHVHVLPVTHEEGFPLTRRELLYLFIDQAQGFGAFDLVCARLGGGRPFLGLVSGEYIKVLVVFLASSKAAKEADPGVADLLAPEVIEDGV